jgi:hypothetical protein
MSYALEGTAPHLAPLPTRTRRHSLFRLWAALSRRRRTDLVPGPPRSGGPAGSGVSPIASAGSRGVAFLISR